jgi:hypothetical protein
MIFNKVLYPKILTNYVFTKFDHKTYIAMINIILIPIYIIIDNQNQRF